MSVFLLDYSVIAIYHNQPGLFMSTLVPKARHVYMFIRNISTLHTNDLDVIICAVMCLTAQLAVFIISYRGAGITSVRLSLRDVLTMFYDPIFTIRHTVDSPYSEYSAYNRSALKLQLQTQLF